MTGLHDSKVIASRRSKSLALRELVTYFLLGQTEIDSKNNRRLAYLGLSYVGSPHCETDFAIALPSPFKVVPKSGCPSVPLKHIENNVIRIDTIAHEKEVTEALENFLYSLSWCHLDRAEEFSASVSDPAPTCVSYENLNGSLFRDPFKVLTIRECWEGWPCFGQHLR